MVVPSPLAVTEKVREEMRSPSSRERLQALPDWSAMPSDSEEDRKLVNQRIAYFGGVVGLLSVAFYICSTSAS